MEGDLYPRDFIVRAGITPYIQNHCRKIAIFKMDLNECAFNKTYFIGRVRVYNTNGSVGCA